jgi:hypothetical protein
MTPMNKVVFWLKGLAVSTVLLCAVTEAHGPMKHEHEAAPRSQFPAPADMGSSVGADAQGRLWLASKASTADGDYLMLQTSDDEGRTWSVPRPASHETIVASGDERPRIAFGARGQVYVSYSRPLAKPYTSELRFIRSEDGRHFSAPFTVHKNADIITHGFGAMVVDGVGDIYIAWIDKRDQQAARNSGAPYAGAAQYYAVSRDGGATFQGDYKIADHSCECCRSALSLNAKGQPMLLWRHVFAPNIRDHALLALTPDGKLAAPERASFDNWSIDACPHQGPALAYGPDGRRHQTWFTGVENGGGVYYATENRDGALGVPMRLGSEQASHADVAVKGRHVALAWKEFDGKTTSIKGSNSYDGGATWHAATLAETAGASDQPRLVVTPHGIVLVWRTRENGTVTVSMPKERA